MTHMDDVSTRFGEVRSLLQRPPSELVWERVCQQLEGLDEDLLMEQVLPYLEGHLPAWAHTPRATPQHWLDRFLRGERVPQLSLCTRLWRRKGTTPAEIQAIGRSPLLARITTVELVSCELDASVVAALVAADCYPALTHLDLSFNPCGNEAAHLIATAHKSTQLISLRLDQCHLTDDGAQSLARSPHLTRLEELTLYNNDIGHWGVEELRCSEFLSHNARRPWLFTHEA